MVQATFRGAAKEMGKFSKRWKALTPAQVKTTTHALRSLYDKTSEMIGNPDKLKDEVENAVSGDATYNTPPRALSDIVDPADFLH